MSRDQTFSINSRNPFSSRIGRRIIFFLVVLSGAVTLMTTLTQTYFDYDREFNEVAQRHREIESVHAELLASSLWHYDLRLLQQRLDGLVNLPKIDYLEITSDNYKFSAGEKVTGERVSNQYPIFYQSPQTEAPVKIGDISVESNAQEIYNQLIRQFLIILIINALKTTFICCVILMIFHISVNRRVFLIAQYLRKYNPRHPPEPLTLPHTAWIMGKIDELTWLADETNKITHNVTLLYNNIKHEQERLADFTNVSSDWLWETDSKMKLVFISEAMRQALDIPENSKLMISEIESLKSFNTLPKLIKQQCSFSMCEETITVNGHPQYLMFQAVARYNKTEFLGYRGTAINITELKLAQLELQTLNQNLESEVAKRTLDLENSIEQLKATQNQLIESEKLAALGGLVAGVAHEVNTPLGIAVTASSVIIETTKELNDAFANQTLTSQQFSELMQRLNDTNTMLENNLNRAAKLIRDFKQTAVDQVSESRSQFSIYQVLSALIASLHPETRKTPVVPQLEGDERLMMNSLPGVLTQIVSNLVMNSINHAFSNTPNPTIIISFYQQDEDVILDYKDNGCGVEQKLHHKIFEPFFTTKRGRGGSGLGLNLVFNLATQKLMGKLNFSSNVGEGVHYVFTFPRVLNKPVIDADDEI
ncbi:PAS domain-containing sensor histidine kinase [Vibrio cholerae]|uniref:PAS domain-containing sensor histidine kinase n=1 Tax=Vibrio cholerae TaxID=666 RepID=UPI001C2F31ED